MTKYRTRFDIRNIPVGGTLTVGVVGSSGTRKVTYYRLSATRVVASNGRTWTL